MHWNRWSGAGHTQDADGRVTGDTETPALRRKEGAIKPRGVLEQEVQDYALNCCTQRCSYQDTGNGPVWLGDIGGAGSRGRPLHLLDTGRVRLSCL